MFEGFVLRKPRYASSNARTTSEGDVFVPESERSRYVQEVENAEYLVSIHKGGNLMDTEFSINWTKNEDGIKRFSFNETLQRWTPLPGSRPDLLGTLPPSTDGLLSLPLIEGGDISLILGNPNKNVGTTVRVAEKVGSARFQTFLDGIEQVNDNEAILNVETGEVLFAENVIASNLDSHVYYFRRSFFDYDESTGEIGQTSEPLYLNPIPSVGQRPLIRIRHASYLEGEHSVTAITPGPGKDFVWSSETGALYIDPSLEGTVYYDGVFCNESPVHSEPHTNLGTIGGAVSNLPDHENKFLYVRDKGVAIGELKIVASASDFQHPSNLPETRAEIARDTGEVNLSRSFIVAYGGDTLMAGNGDFPIEKGLFFRLAPTLADPAKCRGIDDAKDKVRVENAVLNTNTPPGPGIMLNHIPLQDVTGYDDNVFFRLKNGPKERLLIPDQDVVYDFDRGRQLKWLEPGSYRQNITTETFAVQLGHQALYDENVVLELDEGQGYAPIAPERVLFDPGAGLVSFVKRWGRTILEGFGRRVGPSQLQLDQDVPTTPDEKLILILGDDAYEVVTTNGSLIETAAPLSMETDTARVSILETPLVVYNQQLQQLSVAPRAVFPFIEEDAGAFAPYEAPAYEFVSEDQTLPHVLLEKIDLGSGGEDLPLPPYFQEPTSRFRIYVEDLKLEYVTANPGPGQYGVVNGHVILSDRDKDIYEHVPVILVPDPSVGRVTGPIEIIGHSLEINYPSEIDPSTVRIRALVEEDSYNVQGPMLFFSKPFKAGQRLVVRYTSEGGEVEDLVGFRVQEDLGSVSRGEGSKSFGSDSVVDPKRAVTVMINGQATNIEAGHGVINTGGVREGSRIDVSYYVLDARGGEQVVSLLETPRERPFVWEAGQRSFSLEGDIQELVPGAVVSIGPFLFEIVSSSFDGTHTVFQLSSSVPQSLETYSILISSRSISYDDVLPSLIVDGQEGSQELLIRGHVSLVGGHVLKVGTEPYLISSVSYTDTHTVVEVASPLLKDYVVEDVFISKYPLYSDGVDTLEAGAPILTDQDSLLIRMGSDGKGSVITSYALGEDGSIVVDPAATDLPRGNETWFLAHIATDPIRPLEDDGVITYPRFRASYFRYVNASRENGYLGAVLEGTYSYYDPDTFYFRTVPLADFALENDDDSGGGIHNKGMGGLIYEEGHIRDLDRVARAYIRSHNDIISLFEAILEAVSGDIVGDSDGKFLFQIRDDDTPGGEDSVTGELIPYYVNKDNPGHKPGSDQIKNLDLNAQVDFVGNFIDDIIVVSKKPTTLKIGIPLELLYRGTFRSMAEPHKYSRIFPERRKTFTITMPSLGGDDDDDNGDSYSFRHDFREMLADIKQESILSVESVASRSAVARVVSENTAEVGNATRFFVASRIDGDGNFEVGSGPSNPIPEEMRPAFEKGDHVSMGRVTFEEDAGTIVRKTTVYAENMVVTDAGVSGGRGYIDLKKNDATGFGDLVLTDPASISPSIGDSIYTVPPVATSNFQMGEDPPPFYRIPQDMGLDAAGGELINNSLPLVIAKLLGQSEIKPLQMLDVEVSFKNQETQPFRFPALDGADLNDDGDRSLPLISPNLNSEYPLVRSSKDQTASLLQDSTEGFTTTITQVLNGASISLRDTPPPLNQFDTITIEGVLEGSDLKRYPASNLAGNVLTLAAFNTTGTVTFMLDHLHSGNGSSNGLHWEDVETDFTAFSGADTASLKLNVGNSKYNIASLHNGYIITTQPVQVPSGPYTISVEGGTANIRPDLASLFWPNLDFSGASGNLEIVGGPASVIGKTFEVFPEPSPYLRPNLLGPHLDLVGRHVTIHYGDILETGQGAVDVGGSTIITEQDYSATIKEGHYITIAQPSLNAGRYEVLDVNGSELELDSSLIPEGDSGANTYPIVWHTSNPRPGSRDAAIWQRSLVQQRAAYARNDDAPQDLLDLVPPLLNASSHNPSTPVKDRLIELISIVFETKVSVQSGAILSGNVLSGPDFSNVAEGDYVLVKNASRDPSLSLIAQVLDSTSVELEPPEWFGSTSLVDGIYDITVYAGKTLGPQTQELILYEYANILTLVRTIDDSLRRSVLKDSDFTLSRGYATDEELEALESFLEERLDWLPELQREIAAVLKGHEALYDKRYAWIDYRTNLKDGTLVQMRRFEREKDERRAKAIRDLFRN